MKKFVFFILVLLSAPLILMAQNSKGADLRIDIMPKFNGELNAYLMQNIHYPQKAIDKNIEGKVYVKFVVNEDGSISDVTIIKGIGGGCDEEAKRVVMAMPNWSPGMQNGKKVKVMFTLPVLFKLVDVDHSEKAQYVGNLKQYFKDNLLYPIAAQKNQVEGNVRVSFKVNKNGKISRVKVVEGIGSGCDEEAVRLVKNMHEWMPAKNKNGKPVKSEEVLNVPFRGH
jgi:TonB family protein